MTDVRAGGGPNFYGIPLALWLTVIAAVLSAFVALIIAWRSNVATRRSLAEQLARHWREVKNQLKLDAEERGKQRADDDERLSKQFAHDAEQRDKQLAHSAEQNERERRMSLLREVYLDATAALTHLLMLLGRAAHVEYDEKVLLNEFSTNQAKLAKVHLIGTETTVDAIMTYMNELSPALFELIIRRVPLAIRRRAIDAHVDLMNKAGADRERYLTMMQQSPPEGMRDSQTWQAVEARYRLANEQFTLQQNTTAKLREEQMDEQLEIARRGVNLMAQISRVLPGAVAAVRSEMDLPLDRRRYEQLWNVQISKLDYTWKQAMDRILTASNRAPPTKGE